MEIATLPHPFVSHLSITTDPRLDQLWADEAKDRLAAYQRGEISSVDLDEILAKHCGDTERP